ncbi:MAG: protein phosphatase 2C family protein [Candidatus Moraniibacteriota bacterium]|nr:MAG: protein phosphatase 2C family protein [Candidatus Moranbacteria bacterium]
MVKKKCDSGKCLTCMIPRLRPITISQEKREPFLDVFQFSPNNITQKHLGTIFGIFSIDPSKKEALYITNHLASVVKKEYYSKPQRSAEDSFESTLKIIDIILGETFRKGNVSWLENLDGVIVVISKDTIHFSSCGKGRLFLFRENKFLNLTESNEEESAPHPLRTFEDIASGKILSHDIFLLCDRQLLKIFSPEQLKKEISRSPDYDSFYTLLYTALVNECEHAGAILLDMIQDDTPSPIVHTKTSHDLILPRNLFGRDTLDTQKNISLKKALSKEILKDSLLEENENKEEEISTQIENLPEEKSKGRNIHIKESLDSQTHSGSDPHIEALKERALLTLETIESLLTNATKKIQKILQKKAQSFTSKKKDKKSKKRDFSNVKKKIKDFFLTNKKTFSKKNITLLLTSTRNLLEKIKIRKNILLFLKEKLFFLKNKKDTIHSPLEISSKSTFLPSFYKIKHLFFSLNKRQKIYALFLLLIMILIPFFLPKIIPDKKENISSEFDEAALVLNQKESPDTWTEQWEKEKNVIFQKEDAIETISGIPPSILNKTLQVTYWDNRILAVTSDAVVILNLLNNSMESYPPPNGNEIFTLATFMEDLNLLFILTKNNDLYEFSPAKQSYTKNKIPLPSGTSPHLLESYLTYLYIFDTKTKNILRFPRIAGGFDKSTTWFKSTPIQENPFKWNVEESIYFITHKETIESYFQGKKTNFSLESSSAPTPHPKDIAITKNNFLILDSENGRFVLTKKDTGEIQSQLMSKSFFQTKRILAVQENTIYTENTSGDILKIVLP